MLWHFISVLVTKQFIFIVTTWVYWKLGMVTQTLWNHIHSKRCWHINDNNNLNDQVATILLAIRVRKLKLKSLWSKDCLDCLFYCRMPFSDIDNFATWSFFYSFLWTRHFVLNKCGTLSCEIAFCPVLASPPFAAVPTGSKCWFRLPLSENLLPLNHTKVSRWQRFFSPLKVSRSLINVIRERSSSEVSAYLAE